MSIEVKLRKLKLAQNKLEEASGIVFDAGCLMDEVYKADGITTKNYFDLRLALNTEINSIKNMESQIRQGTLELKENDEKPAENH